MTIETSVVAPSRFRVLLIDDRPDFAMAALDLCGDQWPQLAALVPPQKRSSMFVPAVHDDGGEPILSTHFELRWLQTPEEIREYRDLLHLAMQRHPRALPDDVFVPEIICFDYALTGQSAEPYIWPVGTREVVSPIGALRAVTRRAAATEPMPDLHVTGNKDNLGCFAGGLVLTSLADHPCAPVATTRKGEETIAGTDAHFFEWMLTEQMLGTFQAKRRNDPKWVDLIGAGMANFRLRVEQLSRARSIYVSLEDLEALENASALDGLSLRYVSRFGARAVPAAALFIDTPDRAASAQQWARRMLEILFQTESVEAHRQGKRLAADLWDAYDSPLCDWRYSLSDILSRKSKHEPLSPEDEEALPRYLEHFGVVEKHDTPYCTENTLDIASGGYPHRARRWAALFTMVRLSQRAAEASRNWVTTCRQHDAQETFCPELLDPSIDQIDVLVALFPLAGGRAIIESPTTDLVRELVRWNDVARPDTLRKSKDNWGNLSFRVSDVLDGRGWFEDPARPEKEWECGLLSGERFILQLYALDIGFGRESWPVWLRGGTPAAQ